MENLQALILSEVRDLRSDYNAHARDTGERLSRLETQMCSLCGDVQPGRVSNIETDLSDLVGLKNRVIGYSAAVATVVSALWISVSQYLMHKAR